MIGAPKFNVVGRPRGAKGISGKATLSFTGSQFVQSGSSGPHITLVVRNNPGTNPYNGFAEVSDADGVSVLAGAGVTVSGTDGTHTVLYKATSSGGRPDITLAVVFTIGDFLAPALTLPTDVSTGETTANIGATTDEASGTMYVVACPTNSRPSAGQIIAGLASNGNAASAAASSVVGSTGVKTVGVTGLTASTTYYGFAVQRDSVGNVSNIASGDGFTTDAVGADAWLWEDGGHILWEDGGRMTLEVGP